MSEQKQNQRPNWYRLAVSRGVDRDTRRRAWKIIVVIEICVAAAAIAAVYLVPDSVFASTQRQVILVVAAALFIAVLAYAHR